MNSHLRSARHGSESYFIDGEGLLAGSVEEREQPPVAHWLATPAKALEGGAESASGDAWTLLASMIEADDVSAAWAPRSKPQRIEPHIDDAEHQLYQLSGRGPVKVNEALGDPGSPTPRRYVLVGTRSASEFLCAPVPWANVPTGEEVVVEMLVRKHSTNREPLTAVAVRDTAVGSALGYMTLGALRSAGLLFDQAEQMLFLKQTNPLAAAAGGYVLLATEHGAGTKEWYAWIRNLRSRFEWLPDGAIQHGSLLLRHQQSATDVDGAKEALTSAYRRGLPFYSVGVQWLLDGLTLLAGQDEGIARMAAAVRRVAWRCNLQEPFTTLRLRR